MVAVGSGFSRSLASMLLLPARRYVPTILLMTFVVFLMWNMMRMRSPSLPLSNSLREENNYSKRVSNGKPASPVASPPAAMFPPACTESQRQKSARVRPMLETACPDKTWLFENLSNHSTSSLLDEYPILFEPAQGQAPLAIVIGCNKGIDAVDSLRFLSQNPLYDKDAWLGAMNLGARMSKGVCGADVNPQVTLTPTKIKPRSATLHCVEALPSTFAKLYNATNQLQWQDSFVVHHAAASDADGTIMFPNKPNFPGYESHGIEDCSQNPEMCQQVKLTTLDTFFHTHVATDASILDYLSIDVEGFDWAVLQGGSKTLQKTKFVEFEVHNKGVWKVVTLETAITSLRTKGFLCYYLGTAGRLWRLTDCMTGPGAKIWSNVGCANVALAPNLARRMEQVFLETIREK